MKPQVDDVKDYDRLPIVGEKPKSEKEEKWLREIVEYEFMNLKEPGLFLKFPYGSSKHTHTFTLFHGAKYKVPRHVARHLENCRTPDYNWIPDGRGSLQKTLTGTTSRFQMRPVFSGV